MTTVLALWRYPVKSMQGESVAEAAIEVGGIVGDREWALVDQQTGLGLTARREPRLLFAQAATVADDVVITLPDGVETTDAAVLSRWLDREVALVRAAPETVGTFEIGLAEGDDADSDPSVEWFQWQGPAAASTTPPAPRSRSSGPRPSARGTCADSGPTSWWAARVRTTGSATRSPSAPFDSTW